MEINTAPLKLATWNINSVRLRIDQVIRFLETEQPDVLGLQEIKCQNDQFPYEAFREIGYNYIEVAGQKAYHGAATVSRLPMERLNTDFCPVGDARHVSTRVDTGAKIFEFHNFYIPAGGDEPDVMSNPKFKHKLDFLGVMKDYFSARAVAGDDNLVLVGDFNIAPHEHDVWSHKKLLKVVSHTPGEVKILSELQNTHDFIDCARRHAQDDEKIYSWWSYRAKDVLASNKGRRLDHIWVSPALGQAVDATGRLGHKIHTDCRTWTRPSDHAPVTQLLDLGPVNRT